MSSGDGLTIEARERGGVYTLALSGELDLVGAPVLQRALAEAERSQAERILLDIDALEFIDSTGMQAIVLAARRSVNGADRLRLSRGSGHVAAMFRLTALDQTLPFVDEPDSEALAGTGR